MKILRFLTLNRRIGVCALVMVGQEKLIKSNAEDFVIRFYGVFGREYNFNFLFSLHRNLLSGFKTGEGRRVCVCMCV